MEKIFQVSEFNEFINVYLNQMGEVVVEGEISKIEVVQSRLLFITIKDDISSVDIFGITYQLAGFNLLEEGMKVHVYGTPQLYRKNSRFNIRANRIVPAGEGAIKLAFEKLKSKLEQEGLFAPERKRPLSQFPQNIGLITAKGSRAYGDFIKVLSARFGGLKIYFYPVTVQGKGAVESIVAAFNYFNTHHRDLDLLVLTRGGGSPEDLNSFNDERIARAIFASLIPVVCAVGHEDDVSIADLVADLRASTPSNAAELIVPDREDLIYQIDNLARSLNRGIDQQLVGYNQTLLLKVNLLKSAIDRKISALNQAITRFTNQFTLFERQVATSLQQVTHLEALLKSLDPARVLQRGFSITRDATGQIIKSAKSLLAGTDITTQVVDGKIGSRISYVR